MHSISSPQSLFAGISQIALVHSRKELVEYISVKSPPNGSKTVILHTQPWNKLLVGDYLNILPRSANVIAH